MLTEFRVRVGAGQVADVAVDFDRQATVGSLADELASRLRSPSGMTLRVTHRAQLTLDRASPVLDSGLRRGDVVEFVAPSSLSPRPAGAGGATLLVVSGPDQGATFNLRSGTNTIGRGSQMSIRLTDPSVSRHHADLLVVDVVEVADTGSSNGIELNGTPVRGTATLMPGAWLRLGDTTLTVSIGDAIADAQGDALEFNRPPRILPPFEPVTVTFPPPPEQARGFRFPWISLIGGLAMGGVFMALNGGELRTGAFYLFMPLLLVAGALESRAVGKSDHAEAIANWRTLVVERTQRLHEAEDLELRSARFRHPSASEVTKTVEVLGTRLWERQPPEPDFLAMRLGTAALPTANQINVPDGGLADLQAELTAQLGGYRLVSNMPFAVHLRDVGHLGIAGRADIAPQLARAVFVQLASLHSSAEVAIAALLTDDAAAEWDWLKWLPHVRTGSTVLSGRSIGVGTSDATDALGRIEQLVARRADAATDAAGTPLPAVVVLYDAALAFDRARLNDLLVAGPACGVHVVWLDNDFPGLPARVGAAAVIRQQGELADVAFTSTGLTWQVTIETLSAADAERAALRLSPISDASNRVDAAADLPLTVSLPELIGEPHLLSDPNVLAERWAEPNARSLAASVGILPSGQPLTVDVRRDGPHALVAGTTGAGKSEFLQSLIAGLAVNHSPAVVNFLLVDYKGGAAFKDCAALPHTVGMVTDLDTQEVRRVLVSLEAELRRREHQLALHGAKDLVDLELTSPTAAPPSLIIVVDEFAALAREIPEFVDGVVNIAQRGRSLGLHLVLATQRPAGVVTDTIRANTNLRVALRVSSANESVDVIDSPLAADLSRTTPGRAVVRIGASDLYTFQSAYVGGRSSDTAGGGGVMVGSFSLTGHRFPDADDPTPSTGSPTLPAWYERPPEVAAPVGSDLQRLALLARDVAVRAGNDQPFRPWKDPLPATIDLATLGRAPSATLLPVALVDIPERQEQSTYWIDLAHDGHLAVMGASGSGKTVLLRSIAAAVSGRSSSEPVAIYGIDAAGRGLASIESLPEVGSVLAADTDVEQVLRLLRSLRAQVDARGQRFAELGVDDLDAYHARIGHAELARIIVLIDGLPAFYEQYDRIERGVAIEVIGRLLADGRRAGLHFVIASDQKSGLFSLVLKTIQRRIVLRQASADDYTSFDLPIGAIANDAPRGRAIVDSEHHAQIGVVGGDASSDAQQAALAGLAASERSAPPAAPVPVLPRQLPRAQLPPSTAMSEIVIGLRDLDLLPATIDLAEDHFCVFGAPQSGKSSTLLLLAHELRSVAASRHLALLTPRPDPGLTDVSWDEIASGSEDGLALIERLRHDLLSGALTKVTLFVDDLVDLVDDGIDGPLFDLIRMSIHHQVRVIASGDATRSTAWSDSLKRLRSARRGLLLMPHLDKDGELLSTDLPLSMLGEGSPGRGYLAARTGRPALVQVARLT